MATKTKPKSIYATEQQWSDIKDARNEAGYKTLSKFVVDSALSNQTLVLNEVARSLGRLGMICNEVLIPKNEETASLQGSDADAALRKIIKACDKVIIALKRT